MATPKFDYEEGLVALAPPYEGQIVRFPSPSLETEAQILDETEETETEEITAVETETVRYTLPPRYTTACIFMKLGTTGAIRPRLELFAEERGWKALWNSASIYRNNSRWERGAFFMPEYKVDTFSAVVMFLSFEKSDRNENRFKVDFEDIISKWPGIIGYDLLYGVRFED